MKRLILIVTWDSVYTYFKGIDAETLEEVFTREVVTFEMDFTQDDLCKEYGYDWFKTFEI